MSGCDLTSDEFAQAGRYVYNSFLQVILTVRSSSRGPREMRLLRNFVLSIAFCVIWGVMYYIPSSFYIQHQIRQAKTQMLQGRHQEALATLAQADRFQPGDAELHFQLAIVYRRLGNAEQFKTHLKHAQELGFDKTREIERQEILWKAQSGNIGLVEAELQEMRSEDGMSNDTADQIFEAEAKGYMTTYRLQDAWRCMSYWVDNDWSKDSVSPRIWMADLNERTGNLKEARQRYQEVVEMAPDNIEANLAYAKLLLENNSVEEALDSLRKCLEFHPGNKELQVQLMECYYRKPDLEKAEELARSILEGQPTRPQRGIALIQLGKILTKNGEPEKAVEYLEEANALVPSNADPIYALSEAYRFLGNKEKADFYLQKSTRVGQLGTRLSDLQLELNKTPNDVNKMYELAQIMFELEADNEAAAWLKTILNKDGTHYPSMLSLARFYRNQGRSDLADDYIKMARSVQERMQETSSAAPSSGPPDKAGGNPQ